MRIRAGTLRVSCQNTFYSVSGVRVPGGVCTISGTYLFDLNTPPALQTTWELYTAKTQTEVEDRLRSVFLPAFPTVRTTTRGIIVLDMEGGPGHNPPPGEHNSHPNHLHFETDADKALIITAWKRRIAAVRAVFPFARLGVYATSRSGNLGDGNILAGDGLWPARIGALIQAGTAAGYNGVGGAWDGLDLLIPICYQIWGPNDSSVEWSATAARVVESMEGAILIKKSDGSSIPIMPYMSTCVFGAASNDDGVALLDLNHPDPLEVTWGTHLKIFQDYGIREVAVWNGVNSRYALQGKENSTGSLSTHLLASMIHPNKTIVPYLYSSGVSASGQGAITPGLPSGGVSGDIELLVVETANQTITLSNSQGFVEVANSPQGTGSAGAAGSTRLGVYWREWSASNGAPTIADSGDHQVSIIHLFRNCAVTAPATTAGDTAASSPSVSIPGLTTTVDNCLIVAICADAIDSPAERFTNVANSSLTAVAEGSDFGTAQLVGGGITVITGLKATAGIISPTTGTLSSASAQARLCIALRPRSP